MEPMAASCYRNTLLTVSGVSTAVMDTGKYSPNGANGGFMLQKYTTHRVWGFYSNDGHREIFP